MDGIKFLDDNDVKSLFEDNDETSENQEDNGTKSNVTNISDEQAADIFNNNKVFDDDEEDEDDDNDDSEKEIEEKQEENTTKEVKPETKSVENGSNVDFSSIAKQFADEGIWELDDEEVKDADGFKSLIKKAIENGIDEETRRVKEALELGINSQDVAEFEHTIKMLHSITNEDLYDEGDDGNQLRQKLILQNFINEGMEEKKAVEKTKEIFKKGKDIDEAEKALVANKKFFQQTYKDLKASARKQKDEWDKSIQKQTDDLKSSIMSNEKYLGEIDIDEKTKKTALANLSEPRYKDKDSGQMLTAIQKYEKENKTDFLKNLGLLFTLTDGFKNLDKLTTKAVNRRINKQISDIEDVLKNPSGSDTSLSMVTGANNNRLNKFTFGI